MTRRSFSRDTSGSAPIEASNPRLIHCHAGNLFGGVERMLLSLARGALFQTGTPPAFALTDRNGTYARGLEQLGLRFGTDLIDLGATRLSRPWTVARARSRLRMTPGAVLVCHGVWGLSAFAGGARGRPLVLAVHDVPSSRSWLERWASWIRPTRIVVNSSATSEGVSRLWPDVPRETIFPPVPTPPPEAERERDRVRSEFGVGPNDVVIIIASRMEPLKGHEPLIAALGRIARENLEANWRLWIVGGAQRDWEIAYLEALKSKARAEGVEDRVRFLGARDDVPWLLAASDLHCQPNIGPEGFGLAYVEAMHAGLPVVASAFGGAIDVLTPECAELVPPGDVVALADALKRLISDPILRAGMGAEGRRRAASHFALERSLEAWETLPQRLGVVPTSIPGRRS